MLPCVNLVGWRHNKIGDEDAERLRTELMKDVYSKRSIPKPLPSMPGGACHTIYNMGENVPQLSTSD